jgi:uncharacterized phage protein gp47/JayE
MSLSRLKAAISAVEGETDHELRRPTKEDLLVGDGELLVVGSVKI